MRPTAGDSRRAAGCDSSGRIAFLLGFVVLAGYAPAERSAGSAASAAVLFAQTEDLSTEAAPPPPPEPEKGQPVTPEEKRRARSAVVMLSVLAGIALTGLLLIIVAVSIRGLQRKLAGPTRMEREPQDLLPDAVSPGEQEREGRREDESGAADETQYT